MKHYSTIILGGGPSGISCADHLQKRGIDYLIIERQEMLHTWRYERWESFHLVTPNWMTNFPGLEEHIPYNNGYMTKGEIGHVLEMFLKRVEPNCVENTEIFSVTKEDGHYHLETTSGDYTCNYLIIATGLFNKPYIPALNHQMPSDIRQIHSKDYMSPRQLKPGGTLVVGSGRSGIQIALEIKQNTEDAVFLAVGSLTPIPSIYKNINGVYWLNQLSGYSKGRPHLPYDTLDFENVNIMQKFAQNLAACQREGVVLLGRLLDVEGVTVRFGDNLIETLKASDVIMDDVEKRIDALIEKRGIEVTDTLISLDFERPDLTTIDVVTTLDLKAQGISNIIWCTGFKADYTWLKVTLMDEKGRMILHKGRVEGENISFCGLSLETAEGEKSAFGVGLYAVYESAERAVAALFDKVEQ